MWRLLTAERLKLATPDQVNYGMSLEETEDAHAVLDMFDEIDAKTAKRHAEMAGKK